MTTQQSQAGLESARVRREQATIRRANEAAKLLIEGGMDRLTLATIMELRDALALAVADLK